MITDNTFDMSTKSFIILTFFVFFNTTLCFSQYDSIIHDAGYRTYLLHLPPSYSPDIPLPLVLAMHGGFGNGKLLENQSQLSIKSDKDNFIVVYPEGVKSPAGIRTWNAGGCCGYALNNNIDDVGFLVALLDTLSSKYSINPSKVFATGMSNGGFMSYRLACERSDLIAAIAPVASSMNVSECNASRGVPVLHFHSYQDSHVPYEGGVGTGVSSHHNPPIDSVLNVWSHLNSCTSQDTLHNSEDFTHVRWSSCDCQNELHLYLTQDGGHSWPGGNSPPVSDPSSVVINASDLMWAFFKQISLGCTPTGTSDSQKLKNLGTIYPNPFKSFVTIKFDTPIYECNLEIFNTFGEKVNSIMNASGTTIIVTRKNLPKGNYFIRITKNNKLIMANKLIIID